MRSALFLIVAACGSKSESPDAFVPPPPRVEKECINGVTAGDILPAVGDELFVASGCAGQSGESFTFESDRTTFVGNVGCCDFSFHFEVLRMLSTGAPMVLADDHVRVIRFQPGWPQTLFAHRFDDAWMLDMNGDGTLDYVTVADGAIRRGPEVLGFHTSIDPLTEVTLLADKPFRFGAFADFGGSPLPDIFYVTTTGEIGIAIQTAPDELEERVLGSDGGTPKRLSIGDLDGDGRADVVGGSNHVFLYSSKRETLAVLDEGAQATAVGEIDIDTKLDALYITADRSEVRRVVVNDDGTLSSKRVLASGGDALALGDFDHDYRSDVALVHDIGQPTSWIDVWRAFHFEY